MENELILVRLINGDRVIGQHLEYGYDIVAIYAPMQISLSSKMADEDNPKGYYVYSPYDPLSESCLAVFDASNVLTVTRPKKIVEEFYNEAWMKYYPSLEAFKRSMMDQYHTSKPATDQFDEGKLNNMFAEFLKGPKDKKDLN